MHCTLAKNIYAASGSPAFYSPTTKFIQCCDFKYILRMNKKDIENSMHNV